MKNILITFIFSVLSFGLMAEESTNNNQDIKRNSFSIDFGMARNDVMVKSKYTGTNPGYTELGYYVNINDFDAKANLSMSYLRKLNMLDNKLSVGAELQTFFIRNIEDNDYYEGSYISEVSENKSEYGIPLNLILLGQYELIKFKQFDLSLQAGVGIAVHYLSEKNNYVRKLNSNGEVTESESSDGSASSISPSAKIGLVAYYNINDSFAVGVSTNYVYTGKANFKGINDYDYKFKSKGITTTNLSLKYSF